MMTQVLGLLPPMWEMRVEFWTRLLDSHSLYIVLPFKYIKKNKPFFLKKKKKHYFVYGSI